MFISEFVRGKELFLRNGFLSRLFKGMKHSRAIDTNIPDIPDLGQLIEDCRMICKDFEGDPSDRNTICRQRVNNCIRDGNPFDPSLSIYTLLYMYRNAFLDPRKS